MSIVACSVGDCEKPVHVKKRQLCRSHYNRFMYAGTTTPRPAPKTCIRCQGEIKRAGNFGPSPSYCSADCKRQAAYERTIASGAYAKALDASNEARRNRKLPVHTCIRCGSNWTSTHRRSKFCSQNCANKWRDENNELRCTADGCNRGVQAKGLCSMHWKRAHRAAGLMQNDPWDERRKANYQKRRAQKLNLPAETILPLDVYERDEWVCGLCSLPVDRSLIYPDPSSPSLDHITPLSIGGHHVMGNVQLAHLSCNVRKGNRVEADAMSA